MKTSLIQLASVAALAAAVSFCRVERKPSPPPASPAHAEGTTLLGRLPVAFVPNLGQWQHAARFVARIGAMTVFLEERGWTFTLVERKAGQGATARGTAVRMAFAGASAPELVAEERLPGNHNYFLGNDPSKWRSDVPLYRAVRYREVCPGIDVRAREQDGHFEYDLLLRPEADLAAVEIHVEGVDRMRMDDDGDLVLDTAVGPVRMPVPRSWEEGPAGERSEVAVRCVLRGANRFGFEVAGRREGWALVVDPGLVWSTFLGGASDDQARAVALDGQGAATVAGLTLSTNFPTTPGAFDTILNGLWDVFVTQISPTGSSLTYSTFLGGGSLELDVVLALGTQGAATVAGRTNSFDFPTTPGAFDTILNGQDGFVTQLSPTGSSLTYSTFLGGTLDEWANALALDSQGAATIAGFTESTDFPTTPGAFDTTYGGGRDAFVTRLSPTGSSLVWSTYLGGTGEDVAFAVAIDAQGAAFVAGSTLSTDYPTTSGAFDTSWNGIVDAFVSRVGPTGSSLVYSTFLGGASADHATALALDAQGAATVAGYTGSTGFPTTSGAFDSTFNGLLDAFVTRLSPTGSGLVWSTYLGGTGEDRARALAIDAKGEPTVAGYTTSTNFPTTAGAFDTTFNGQYDAFVSRLSATGSSLVYSTHIGGSGDESVHTLAVDAQGAAIVAGKTNSLAFPTTTGAYNRTYGGNGDAFVANLDLLPTGASAFGRSSPSCTGPLAISVTSMPRVGNATFALTCGNAPPNSAGLAPLTGAGLTTPLPVLGIDLWVNPAQLWFLPSVTSNGIGAAELPLPVPADPTLVGGRIYAQFLWVGPSAPPPCPPMGISASNALEITIQS